MKLLKRRLLAITSGAGISFAAGIVLISHEMMNLAPMSIFIGITSGLMAIMPKDAA